jgi:pyruvate/2-oxoglutarate dehydrogenase complex dihydrolipoamide dehydrogenase (E3) component
MDVDVIVIGAGQAGVPLAARLAEAGRRVLMAERHELGGTCVNTGCTPTKTMIASARAAHVARTAGRLGVEAGPVRVDLAAVVRRKDAIVREWRESVERRLRKAGDRLRLLPAHARFVGPREVEAGGERHRAPVVVINAGARPAWPPIPGLDAAAPLDNRTVMELTEVPAHLLVLGAGYIGCEFAQMFRRFGSEVTLIDHGDRLLAMEDPDTSQALKAVFEGEGVRFELASKAESVSRHGAEVAVRLPRGEVRGSHLLVATGRRPNTDDLGCDAAGIALDAHGFIPVDDHYRTSAEGVYAVGDVTPGPQFTHASWDDHRRLFDHLVRGGGKKRSERLVPITAFTDPQVARVGLTEQEAHARGVPFEKATMPFGDIARAVETGEVAGTMKVMIDPATERLVGAAIVGAEAGELIHVFVSVMQAGATARAVVDAEMVHPTFAEGLQSLLMRLPRYAL